jgi:hypothetical protein
VLADIKGFTKHCRVTLFLLSLLAHAILVTITHHHRLGAESPVGHSVGLAATRVSIPMGLGDTGGDSGCLSCSLQRNFVSDLRPIRTPIQTLTEPEKWETILLSCPSTGPCLTTCNRAPPLSVIADVTVVTGSEHSNPKI